jgi:hypothetical protein
VVDAVGTVHDVAMESIRRQTGMRNVYVNLHGIPVIHSVNQRSVLVDEVGDTINSATYVDQTTRIVVDLSAYYRILAAFRNATNENDLRLRGSVCTDYNIMPGDRVKFTHHLYSAITEDKEWYVADVQVQAHGIVVSKSILLAPLRDV